MQNKYPKPVGTFLPLFSLHSSKTDNTGTIAEGFPFIDWLHKTHQSYWQMLPLHETHLITNTTNKHVASPYKGYGVGIAERFQSDRHTTIQPTDQELALFQSTHAAWLPDYALFCALRDKFGTDNWLLWDNDIRNRDVHAVENWKSKLSTEIEKYVIEQWRGHKEVAQLQQYAKARHIELIGDLPFYLPLQSPLVWMYQHIFKVSNDTHLPRVSGVANEPKATYGRQVWGHPLYRWEILSLHYDILSLFKVRLSYLSTLFDMVRLDHANGFFLYGSIDPHNEHNDQMVKGPGFPVFKEIIAHCRSIQLAVFAEDAAVDLNNLRAAMKTLEVPGIKILKYAYNQDKHIFESDYVNVSSYPDTTVVYSTTHDTETLLGFVENLSKEEKANVAETLGIPNHDDIKQYAEKLRNLALHAPGQMTIVPMQDWLLSPERINIPGTENEANDPNWKYIVPLPVETFPAI